MKTIVKITLYVFWNSYLYSPSGEWFPWAHLEEENFRCEQIQIHFRLAKNIFGQKFAF